MGLLKPFSRQAKSLRPERLPSGCFTVHREGCLVASTLPSSFSETMILEIGKEVLAIFSTAEQAGLALTDLHLDFSGIAITARELRGGALVFLQPATLQLPHQHTPPAMHYKTIEEFILHLENYIECWKQFNLYVNLARDKKFAREDEMQFLELKSVIAQGLEAIIASTEKGGPKKEEVHHLFAQAPSLRYLADGPDAIPAVEGAWHKVYLGLQSLLGQLKVQQNKTEKGTGWSLFGRSK
jgi:hypothetical protein